MPLYSLRGIIIKTRAFFLIFLLAFFWSFTFLLIRITVEDVNPVVLTFYRLTYALSFLCLVSIIRKAKLFSYGEFFGKLVISSFFLNALPFTLCAIGEVHIDSSTTGIIEGTTPFFVLLFAWLFFNQKTISWRQIRAFSMGFLGLLVIFYPFISKGAFKEVLGLGALLGMAISFAFGFEFSEKYLKKVPPLEAVTIQLFCALIMLLPFVLYLNNGSIPLIPLKAHTFLAILGISSSLGWLTYFYAILATSATNVSFATMICPLITLIWGRVFLNEPLAWNKILGASIVLGALSILWNCHGHFYNTIKKNATKRK